MTRDIMVEAISKGQSFGVLFGVILIVMVLRMPPQDLSRIAFRLLDMKEWETIGGWIGTVGITVAWAVHVQGYKKKVDELLGLLRQGGNDVPVRD